LFVGFIKANPQRSV